MASYDDTAVVSGTVVSIENGADEVGAKSCVVTVRPTLSGVSSVTETQTGKNLLDTANAETKENNSVSITCDGNGKYTATGTATGGSANITFTLKTPCEIKSGMYLHLMNVSANASVSITLQKQDNTTIYAPALSPANRIVDLSSYAGQTIYSIRFYVANGATFGMSLTPMLCFSSTATTFEPYQTPTQYTASLGRTIYGGEVDIVNGTGTDENGNDFTFTGQEVPTRLGYNAFWSDSGDTELTYYKSGYGFTSVTIHKETPSGEPVVETAKFHQIVYGGTADVVKGTCEPKNLLDDSKRVFTAKNIIFGRDSGGRDDFCLKLKAGTYTFSVTTADGTYTNLYLKNSDTKESISGFPAYATSSKSFTLAEDTNCAVFVYKSDYTSVSDITSAQIEKGSSASEYVPHFEPFSFPPISMETDEGENTLYANEGASAITYRKETD